MIPTNGKTTYTLTAQWGNVHKYYFRYFIETLNGNEPGSVKKGNTYYLENEAYAQYVTSSSGNISPKELDGCKAVLTENNGTYGRDFYYTRNSYTLTFDAQDGEFSNGESIISGKVKFGGSIQAPQTPPKLKNYEFVGWYTNAECYGEPYDFDDAVMPHHNLTLFAKYESTDHTVTFYDSVGGTKLTSQGVATGKPTSDPNIYTENTYVEGKGVFTGWYWYIAPSRLVKFGFETPIYKDIDLYAQWQTDGFTITYKNGDGSGAPPTDADTYKAGTMARVLSGNSLNPPYFQSFIGWKIEGDDSSAIYYPGSLVKITGNLTLVAQYGYSSNLVHVTYKNNYNASLNNDVVWNVYKNNNITLADALFTRSGYTQIGWTKTKGGTTVQYALGKENFDIDRDDITLYAVWKSSNLTISFAASQNGSLKEGMQTSFSVASGAIWGQNITVPTPVANNGYYFSGWAPALPEDNSSITKNQEYTAQFKKQTNITVTALDESRAFTGNQINVTTGGKLTSGTLAQGHTLTAQATGTGKEPNTYPISIQSVSIMDGQTDVTHMYNITNKPGTLTITTAGDITGLVTVTGKTTQYDGANHGVTVDTSKLVHGVTTVKYSIDDGKTYSTAAPTFRNAGSHVVKVKVTNTHYSGTFEGSATVEITKRPITLSTEDKSWPFDNNPHSWPVSNQGSANVATGDVLVITVTGSITGIGTTPNAFTYTLKDPDKEDASGNYNITESPGTLTITTVGDITGLVTVTGETTEYDGANHGITVDTSKLIFGTTTIEYSTDDGQTYTPVAPTFRNVGSYVVSVKVTNIHYSGTYEGTATVEITKRALTLTAQNYQWPYTGDEYTWPEYDQTGTAATGDTLLVTVTGSITDVGKQPNTLTYTLEDKDGQDMRANYNITVANGELEVYPGAGIDGKITFSGQTLVYDGNSHTLAPNTSQLPANGALQIEYSEDGETYGETIPQYRNAGTYPIYVRVSHSYYEEVFAAQANLVITTRALTLTAQNQSWNYDGETHSWPHYNQSGAVGTDDVLTVTVTGSITAIGTAANTLTYTLADKGGQDMRANYTITVQNGTLTVNTPPPSPVGPGGGSSSSISSTPPPVTAGVSSSSSSSSAPVSSGSASTTTIVPSSTPATAPSTQTISGEDTPLAGVGSWALLNLILAILSSFGAILLLVGIFARKRATQPYGEDDTQQETDEPTQSTGVVWRILGIALGIASLLIFAFTTNMNNPMAIVNQWTVLLFILAILQVLSWVVLRIVRRNHTQNTQQI